MQPTKEWWCRNTNRKNSWNAFQMKRKCKKSTHLWINHTHVHIHAFASLVGNGQASYRSEDIVRNGTQNYWTVSQRIIAFSKKSYTTRWVLMLSLRKPDSINGSKPGVLWLTNHSLHGLPVWVTSEDLGKHWGAVPTHGILLLLIFCNACLLVQQ